MPVMLHICHVITRLIVGGAQENTLLTCEGLHERGYRVSVPAPERRSGIVVPLVEDYISSFCRLTVCTVPKLNLCQPQLLHPITGEPAALPTTSRVVRWHHEEPHASTSERV